MSILKTNLVAGVAAALAASVIVPVLIPALRKGARPLAKSLVRSGVHLYESSRDAVVSAGDAMDDIVAEVRAESRKSGATSVTRGVNDEVPRQPVGDDGGSPPQFERAGAT